MFFTKFFKIQFISSRSKFSFDVGTATSYRTSLHLRLSSFNPIQMSFFAAAHGWGAKRVPL